MDIDLTSELSEDCFLLLTNPMTRFKQTVNVSTNKYCLCIQSLICLFPVCDNSPQLFPPVCLIKTNYNEQLTYITEPLKQNIWSTYVTAFGMHPSRSAENVLLHACRIIKWGTQCSPSQ